MLGGAAHAADGRTIEAIRRAAFGVRRGRQLRGIIVLMDPDDAGRRGAVTRRSAAPALRAPRCPEAYVNIADATDEHAVLACCQGAISSHSM